jgi:hypothetical protein
MSAFSYVKSGLNGGSLTAYHVSSKTEPCVLGLNTLEMNEMILLDEDGQDQAQQPDRTNFDVAVRNQGITKTHAKLG